MKKTLRAILPTSAPSVHRSLKREDGVPRGGKRPGSGRKKSGAADPLVPCGGVIRRSQLAYLQSTGNTSRALREAIDLHRGKIS